MRSIRSAPKNHMRFPTPPPSFIPANFPIFFKAVTAVSALLAMGCDEEKPYTPLQVATSLPREAAPDSEPAPTEEPDDPSFSAESAPQNSVLWEIFDRTIRAPEGTFIRTAIPIPDSESKQLIAWFTPKSSNDNARAGLWTVDLAGNLENRIHAHPDFLPSGKGCEFEPTLRATGKHSITARIRSKCADRLLPGTAVESILLLTPQAQSPVPIALRLLDSAPGERLTVRVDSSDQDGDGIDDARVDMTLRSPDGHEETLPFLWLLRPAGASRQPDQPAEALKKRASRLSISAVRKAERDAVRTSAETLQRLLGAVCREFGTTRIQLENGDGLRCGEIWSSLFELARVTVQAELGRGNVTGALGVAERSDWIGKPLSAQQTQSLSEMLKKKIPFEPAKQLARFDTALRRLETAYASPLHFDAQGQLWAQTKDGETKRLTMKGDPPLVTPATEDEPEQRITAPEWSIELPGPSGERLSSALASCQRSEVQLAFTQPTEPPRAPLPIPLLAPRPGNCLKFSGVDLTAVPLFWSGGQLNLALGGELIRSGGHARSVDAAWAFGTRFGIAVQKGEELSLWKVSDPAKHHHCAIRKDAGRLACVKGPSVFVYELDESKP